jgi:medium-chain acyl-[acyl-carrier-protein] hydrolase
MLLTPWIARFNPDSQADINLFCFPYSGAGASAFYTWAYEMPDAVNICPVQLPGRETRLAEALHHNLEILATAVAVALRPFLHQTFAFFGHSMGALVAFEVARQLQAEGIYPQHLFVSGYRAPHLPDPDPPIHALPEDEFIQKLRALNGTPAEVLDNAELRELILPILRADFAVCETFTYNAGLPLSCPITALGGLHDIYVSRDSLEAWCKHTTATFKVRMFPGDHFFINSARAALLPALARDLMQSRHPLTQV